ncbi:hypothetical protein ABTK14_22060, partial [Acinetobacter baumannii]
RGSCCMTPWRRASVNALAVAAVDDARQRARVGAAIQGLMDFGTSELCPHWRWADTSYTLGNGSGMQVGQASAVAPEGTG